MKSLTATIALGTVLCALALAAAAPATNGARADIDWNAVSAAIGVPGTMQTGGVYRIDLPRSDLQVKVGLVLIKPSFALGGYLTFLPTGGSNAMAMGDLVLTETELQRVVAKLAGEGIDITAIHNHLLSEKPTVMYVHVNAMGDAVQIAQEFRAALVLSKTPLKAQKHTAADDRVNLPTAQLDQALGATGKISGGVYKYSFAPKYTVTSGGMTIPASMGIGTGFAFQPLGGGRAAITGDFALLPAQVNPVLRTLRVNAIAVTSLHSHMLDVSPAMFFMHFYATGNALSLAQRLHAAAAAGGV